jgi:hypothetical protein
MGAAGMGLVSGLDWMGGTGGDGDPEQRRGGHGSREALSNASVGGFYGARRVLAANNQGRASLARRQREPKAHDGPADAQRKTGFAWNNDSRLMIC